MNRYRVSKHWVKELNKNLFYLVIRTGASRWGGYVKKNGKSMDSTGSVGLNPNQFTRSKATAWYGSVEHAIRHIEKFEKGEEFQVEVEYDHIDLENTQPMQGDTFRVANSKIIKRHYVTRNGMYMDKSGKTHENACPTDNRDNPIYSLKDSAWYKDLTHAIKTMVKVSDGKNFTVNVLSRNFK